MKKILLRYRFGLILLGLGSLVAVGGLDSCKVSEKASMKTGAQLWAENCQRCHNTPSPSTFSHEQWETIGMHMQSRALITDAERDKIVAFLSQ
ncbi:MAG TPA: cytochrome c [Chitinophagaceae bacterium]|nr:cytochrome c [Chitinophagaceae bacterium]